jgi:hypothetical protein
LHLPSKRRVNASDAAGLATGRHGSAAQPQRLLARCPSAVESPKNFHAYANGHAGHTLADTCCAM